MDGVTFNEHSTEDGELLGDPSRQAFLDTDAIITVHTLVIQFHVPDIYS